MTRYLARYREEIYDLRASCALAVRGCFKAQPPRLFARSRIIVAFNPIAPRDFSDAIRKRTVKYKNRE